jgi:hypothetical protein
MITPYLHWPARDRFLNLTSVGQPAYVPSLAVDGNAISTGSRWVSERNDPDPWLAVDLGNGGGYGYTILGASMVVGWSGSICLQGLCSYNISVWSGSSSTSFTDAVAQLTTGWTPGGGAIPCILLSICLIYPHICTRPYLHTRLLDCSSAHAHTRTRVFVDRLTHTPKSPTHSRFP